MARKVNNDKGFMIIGITPVEGCEKCGYGSCGIILCDICNKSCKEDKEVYYCAVLNRVLCKHCYDNWVNGAYHYDEDIPYETKYYNYYANKLKL